MNGSRQVLVLGGGTAGVLHAALLSRNPGNRVTLAFRSKSPVPVQGSTEVILPDETSIASLDAPACVPSPDLIPESYDDLILCTPLHETLSALEDAIGRKLLRPGSRVVSIATTLGLPEALRGALNEAGLWHTSLRVYSNFFAAARPTADLRQIKISKIKKRIFYWEDGKSQDFSVLEKDLFCGALQIASVQDPVELACRNINTWVHPPLVFQNSVLNSILTPGSPRVALYDLGAGGAVHAESMLEMGCYMQELEGLFRALNIRDWNTLRFLNDDNYPVEPRFLSLQEIETFPLMVPEIRGPILLRRYEGLKTGSSAPIYPEKAILGRDGQSLKIPRIPMEDVFQLQSLKKAAPINVRTPMIDLFLERYETALTYTESTYPHSIHVSGRADSRFHQHKD